MSRLSFKEDHAEEDGLGSHGANSDDEVELQPHLSVSSYQLMNMSGGSTGRSSNRGSQSRLKGKNDTSIFLSNSIVLEPNIKSNRQHVETDTETDEEEEAQFQPHKAAPQNDIRPSGDNLKPPTAMDNTSTSDSNKTPVTKVSKWLQNFLVQKKDPAAGLMMKPEMIPLNDAYIQQFAQSSIQQARHRAYSQSSVSSTTSSDDEDKPIILGRKIYEYHDPLEDEKKSGNSIPIKLFNLPYRLTSDEIIEQARQYDFMLENVVINLDRATNEPRGSANAVIKLQDDLDEGEVVDVDGIVSSLHGKDFGGRPVRIERADVPERRRRSSAGASSRYFGLGAGIGIKCNLCGGVGHKMSECTNEPMVPCNLCARMGHEAVDCSNIICFRCGDFGHHAKYCNSYSNSDKPVLCTTCGGTTHDNRSCPKINTAGLTKIENENIVCMSCGKMGHATCRRTVGPPDREIYCPNCGERGHHSEYPDIGGRVTCSYFRTDNNYRGRERTRYSEPGYNGYRSGNHSLNRDDAHSDEDFDPRELEEFMRNRSNTRANTNPRGRLVEYAVSSDDDDGYDGNNRKRKLGNSFSQKSSSNRHHDARRDSIVRGRMVAIAQDDPSPPYRSGGGNEVHDNRRRGEVENVRQRRMK